MKETQETIDAWEEMERKMDLNRSRPQEFYDSELKQKRDEGIRTDLERKK